MSDGITDMMIEQEAKQNGSSRSCAGDYSTAYDSYKEKLRRFCIGLNMNHINEMIEKYSPDEFEEIGWVMMKSMQMKIDEARPKIINLDNATIEIKTPIECTGISDHDK
jgi:hypothetical protein